MLKWYLAVLFSLSSTTEGNADSARVLVCFDTEGSDPAWYAVNDDVMGGRSRGGFEISDGSLVFSGEINTNGGGFSSIRTASQRLDAVHSSIRLRVRGDGRTYKFRLGTVASEISYMAEFQTRRGEWQDVELPFSAFLPSWRGRRLNGSPVEPSDITSVGFMISDQQDGPFVLEVDCIKVR